MIKKSILGLLGITLLGGCSLKRENEREEIKVNGSEYRVSNDEIVQTKSSFLEDNVLIIGAVSDIEGNLEKAVDTAMVFEEVNVDAVVIAGDCYENERIRVNPKYPDSRDNVQEMIAGIKPYAFLGVPVFVIPGNHEEINVYNEAISNLRVNYPNVFDINNKEVDLIGINMVGMGGYHDKRFTSPGGFHLRREDYEKALAGLKELYKQGENTILVTHSPPYSDTKIDYVENAGNVGDKAILYLLNQGLEKIINLNGHIHEGGGSCASFGENLSINVASVGDYNTRGGNCTILTFNHLLRNIGIKRYAPGEEIK